MQPCANNVKPPLPSPYDANPVEQHLASEKEASYHRGSPPPKLKTSLFTVEQCRRPAAELSPADRSPHAS